MKKSMTTFYYNQAKRQHRATADFLGQNGLFEVPDWIRRNLSCIICNDCFPNIGKLWVEGPREPRGNTQKHYSDWLDEIRAHCYCTHHAMARAKGQI